MERIKNIKDQILSQIESQMGDLKKVNTKELGEAVDMIKDLAETMYYCEIYKQMEESEKQEQMRGTNNYYYTERYYDPMYYRDMDRSNGRMYYSVGEGSTGSQSGNMSSNSNSNSSTAYYTEMDYPITLHDDREGRSPQKRKMYMESKATHQNNTKIIKDLENYMNELTSDMVEMLDKATPEEKAIVQRKIEVLSNKIQNV